MRKIVARGEFVSQADDERRIAALYQIIFQREPLPDESRLGGVFLSEVRTQLNSAEARQFVIPPEFKPTPTRRQRKDPQPGQNHRRLDGSNTPGSRSSARDRRASVGPLSLVRRVPHSQLAVPKMAE